jgi:hypothetical protein
MSAGKGHAFGDLEAGTGQRTLVLLHQTLNKSSELLCIFLSIRSAMGIHP